MRRMQVIPQRRQVRQSWEGDGIPGTFANAPHGYSNVQFYSQNLPPSGTMALDSGNFFFLFSAGAAITAASFIYDSGQTEVMQSFPVGCQVKRVKSWTRVQLTGVGSTPVQFWHGWAFSREDQTNFQSTIATIAGTVSTAPGVGTANSPTVHADVVLTTATGAIIAANAARKLLIVGSLSTNAPATTQLRLGTSAAAQGIELQAGTWISLPLSGSIGVWNGDANTQTFWYEELT